MGRDHVETQIAAIAGEGLARAGLGHSISGKDLYVGPRFSQRSIDGRTDFTISQAGPHESGLELHGRDMRLRVDGRTIHIQRSSGDHDYWEPLDSAFAEYIDTHQSR